MAKPITECPCCGFDKYTHTPQSDDNAVLTCPQCYPRAGRVCEWVERILSERELVQRDVKSTFIPKGRVAEFANDVPSVTFQIGAQAEPEELEALEGMFFSERDINLYLKGELSAKQLSNHLNAYILQAYRMGKPEPPPLKVKR
jgi:hypothetical protein